VETLRRAAGLRPGDPKPLQRLSELHLRQGEWKAAVEALRACEPRLADIGERAALHLRVGSILRDLGRDAQGAAAAFRRAAELDPLGEGTAALVALHDSAGDAHGALVTVDNELADVRRALAADPLTSGGWSDCASCWTWRASMVRRRRSTRRRRPSAASWSW
jgi:tetratricopeptide (TPR) repeat protein